MSDLEPFIAESPHLISGELYIPNLDKRLYDKRICKTVGLCWSVVEWYKNNALIKLWIYCSVCEKEMWDIKCICPYSQIELPDVENELFSHFDES